MHLSVPSIGFVYVFVYRKLSPHLEFESWITGVCSPYVVSCYVLLNCYKYDVCKKKSMLAVCMLVGIVV